MIPPRSFAALALWLALAGSALAAPRLVFEHSEHNMGSIVQGEQVEVRFGFHNDGDQPLLIQRLKPSCGCTASLATESEIAPGARGEIIVRFDSTGRLGYEEVRILVYSNDPAEGPEGPYVKVLQIHGEVDTLYRIEPPAAYFANIICSEVAELVTQQIDLQAQAREAAMAGNQAALTEIDRRYQTIDRQLATVLEATVAVLPAERGASFTVTGVEPGTDLLRVVPSPFTDPSTGSTGSALRIRVSPEAPPGRIEAMIRVHTDMARQPIVEVPVIALVNPPILCFPDRIPFYMVPKGEASPEHSVTFERIHGEGLPIISASADPALFELSIREVIPGRRTEILVRIRPDAPPGLFQSPLVVWLDDPYQPYVEVPLFGEIQGELTLSPRAIYVSTGSGTVAGELTMRRRTPGQVTVSHADIDVAGIDVAVSGTPGRTITLRLSGTAPATRTLATLTITTDIPGEITLRVPVLLDPGEAE